MAIIDKQGFDMAACHHINPYLTLQWIGNIDGFAAQLIWNQGFVCGAKSTGPFTSSGTGVFQIHCFGAMAMAMIN